VVSCGGAVVLGSVVVLVGAGSAVVVASRLGVSRDGRSDRVAVAVAVGDVVVRSTDGRLDGNATPPSPPEHPDSPPSSRTAAARTRP
jgi:hypothetical protein